jgi:putative PIN family toxin of toxin-antitoxin system
MIKLVTDTNIVVSGTLVDKGPSAAILELATSRQVQMFVSPAILAEYENVLRRPRFKLDPARITALLRLLASVSIEVLPSRTLTTSPDETDNRFLECAEEAGADFLVTGNIRHFPSQWQTTKIITPRNFIDLIIPKPTQGE